MSSNVKADQLQQTLASHIPNTWTVTKLHLHSSNNDEYEHELLEGILQDNLSDSIIQITPFDHIEHQRDSHRIYSTNRIRVRDAVQNTTVYVTLNIPPNERKSLNFFTGNNSSDTFPLPNPGERIQRHDQLTVHESDQQVRTRKENQPLQYTLDSLEAVLTATVGSAQSISAQTTRQSGLTSFS
jgi:hypothetical protein